MVPINLKPQPYIVLPAVDKAPQVADQPGDLDLLRTTGRRWVFGPDGVDGSV
jgi:hypothetical protein